MSFVDSYLNTLVSAINQLDRDAIQAVIDLLLQARADDRTIFIVGNGGSAATASHMMNDLNKLTIVPGKRRFRAIALTDNMPLITAWGNDADYNDVFAEPMRNLMRDGDVLIAISCSGNSGNVIRAIEVARSEFDAQVVGLTGDQGGKLAGLADVLVKFPDPHIGRQEDGHLILNHVIANALAEHLQHHD